MPELPEVETIRLGLHRKIIGLKIKKVEVLSPKSFLGNPSQVEGKIVQDVWRRGKMLGIELSSYQTSVISHQTTLLFHLKMTGQVIYDDGHRFVGGHPTADMRDEMPNSHTRVVFTFSDGSHLYFNDQRRFGWIKIIKSADLPAGKAGLGVQNFFINLGPEPLDKSFTWQIFKTNLLRHRSQPVKVAIMDQTVVVGIGNIYASEACFNTKIDPRTKVHQLTDKVVRSLHRGVLKALRDGIKYGGSTRAHFVDAEGHKGYFLDYAHVYGRDKHPCKICGTIIQKITLAGRGTYLCPKCQK